MKARAEGGLIQFLLARIAEDEAFARNAQRSYQHVLGIPHYFDPTPGEFASPVVGMSPRAALAECAAKRRIVEGYWEPTLNDLDTSDDDQPAPLWVLRALALPYADHPDYDDEWGTPAPVSSGEAGTGEAGSQWEEMLRDPNEQFDVKGEVAQVILDATGYKPNRLLGGPWAGIQHEAWLAGECGNTIEEPVQVTTASAKPSKPTTTWIADLCGLPKGHDGDCVKRGDLPAPVVTPSAEGSA